MTPTQQQPVIKEQYIIYLFSQPDSQNGQFKMLYCEQTNVVPINSCMESFHTSTMCSQRLVKTSLQKKLITQSFRSHIASFHYVHNASSKLQTIIQQSLQNKLITLQLYILSSDKVAQIMTQEKTLILSTIKQHHTHVQCLQWLYQSRENPLKTVGGDNPIL